MGFSSPRNDKFVVYCHCEEWNDEAIHKPQNHYQKQKRKKFINRIIMPYTEIATGLWPSQWQWGLGVVVVITRLPQAFGLRNDKSKINEIATSCKQLSQWQVCVYCHCERSEAIYKSQKAISFFVITSKKTIHKSSLISFVIAKAEGLWQSTNHKKSMQKQKIKRIHHPFSPLSLRTKWSNP